jgi:tetratricopeptide (TPR) repeat protein
MTTHCDPDSNQVSNLSYRWIHHLTPKSSTPGESPPLPSRTFFGRDELIEKIIDVADKFIPIALIGAGGIGKTSISLAILHHDRIKRRFGDNRRFIRCDKFPASHSHLLRQLSNVIGARVENPETLTPLRKFLSSKEMMIVLDNAESILDPQGTDAEEIYAVVEELSGFSNICICITSRISTTPPGFKHLDVPTLSMDAAQDTFYRIYESDVDRSNVVSGILEQLDFHPLSITLLATVAHQNKWDMNRLAREWEERRTSVLQTQHNKSLATTIELSLASPLFRELGPDARGLLGVVAFFPQGIDEDNLKWLFPTISNRTDVFDRFCILSLTYRSNGFITMLAPLRDHLSPKDPKTSPLLCATKEHYFTRMSVKVNPDKPNFGETRWITSEDVNVEHLLDVFTTIDADSEDVWDACTNFMTHLVWHKTRPTILKPKIEGLPDDHRSKLECLLQLSRLFGSVGNDVERGRLLLHVLELWRERGDDMKVAATLMELSVTNRRIGLYEEGIQQAREALEVYERLGDTAEHADCLIRFAWLLHSDKQFDAAEEAASHAIDLLPEEGEQYRVCGSHRVLGNIYRSKGNTEKAIHHFEVALGIASSFNWHDFLFGIHYELASLFRLEGKLDEAQAHVEHTRSHMVGSAYYLGLVMEEQARVWNDQRRLEEAKSEALRTIDIYNKLGAAGDMERCRTLLRVIEEKMNATVASV